MYPILFEIGPFTLHSLWLFVTIAFVVGIISFAKIAKRQRLDLGMLFNHGISIIFVSLLISRLTFFLSNLQYYMPTFSFRGLLSFFFKCCRILTRKKGRVTKRLFDCLLCVQKEQASSYSFCT